MRRELLVLDEIIAAAERASTIAAECSVDELGADINARDALLWNLRLIGEACSQLPGSLRAGFPEIE